MDLEQADAAARLRYSYSEMQLGDTAWDPPAPLALAVGSFVAYIVVFALAFVTPLPSAIALESMKKIHNYALAAYSAFCCGFTVWWLIAHGHTTADRFMCVDFAGAGADLVTTSFAISKVWEWGDTILLVWGNRIRGKPWTWTNKTVLHCFHHSTTFWLFLIVSVMPCSKKTGTLLNGGVHTVMYFYYADPSVFPKKWTPLITQGQIAQLITVTLLWNITPRYCPEFATFPETHPAEFATPQFFVITYIIMFMAFYAKRFKKDDASQKKMR